MRLPCLALLLLSLIALASPPAARCEDEPGAKVVAALEALAQEEGTYFHKSDALAALGPGAIEPLAKVLGDGRRRDTERALAADALGRIHVGGALTALRAALADGALPLAVRHSVEASCYLQGFTEPIDERVALLGTKHRRIALAADGAQSQLAHLHAATGRHSVAARLMRDLVRRLRGQKSSRAANAAYNWACYAALAGDKTQALAALAVALESERTDLDWAEHDPDLVTLRGDPGFTTLLAEARARRAKARAAAPAEEEAWKQEPGAEEYVRVKRGYSDAFDAFIEANNRYYDNYEPWLKARGLEAGPEGFEAYTKEHGPEPVHPRPEWKPRFEALMAKLRGTALGARVRGDLLMMLGNDEEGPAFTELFVEGLAQDPNLASVADQAEEALYFAREAGASDKMRAAVAEALAAKPDDPGIAALRLALAKDLRGNAAAAEARAALAAVAAAHPGTRQAEEAEGAIYEMDRLTAGKPAPTFDAVDIMGQPWSLAAHKGKVVVLDFWATWCGPCLGELPHVKALAKEAGGADFALLGISFDGDGWTLAEFLEAEGMDWPQLCDLKEFKGDVAKLYHVRGIPRTVLIDREGRIAAMDLRGDALQAEVKKLLAAPR